jgi:DNA-directed RNA polymerase subunit RPC12/RpoP
MKLSEFTRAVGVYNKRTAMGILGPCLIAFLLFLAYTPFQDRFESFLSTRFDSFNVYILTHLPMALTQIITILCIFWLAGRIQRQSGVRCPHCAKGLVKRKRIVIASRNCPYCGKRVIEDEK